MSLIDKNTIRPYICGVYLCFGTSFTAQTTFQNFYDTELLEADVVSLYATKSKVSFTETKTSSRSGDLYQQRISISLPIGDNLRSEHINRIHQAEQVVLKLTNGEYLYIGRNDAFQNTKPKIAYNGDENTARFQFTATSMAPFGYTDIENIPEGSLFENIVAYYKLDEASGQAIDVINSYNGNLFGGITQAVTGKINTAYDFNGSNSYVEIPNHPNFSFTDGVNDIPFTIRLWVKFDSLSSSSTLISKRKNDSFDREWQLDWFENKLRIVLINNNDTPNLDIISAEFENTNLSTNQWYQVVATYDGSMLKEGLVIYLNGIDVTNLRNGGINIYNGMTATSSPVTLGYNGGWNVDGYYLDGQLDEVAIIRNEAWTPEKVLQDYNDGVGTTI